MFQIMVLALELEKKRAKNTSGFLINRWSYDFFFIGAKNGCSDSPTDLVTAGAQVDKEALTVGRKRLKQF